MSKYDNVLTHDCLNNIANELAEANRLKRLELSWRKSPNWDKLSDEMKLKIEEELEDKA